MIKRTTDIIASSVALIVLLPLILLLCLMVGRKPIFTQIRYGKDKRLFTVLKIRTMNALAPGDNRKIEDIQSDRRITRVGKFLRVFHLDELPQLVNILKGDMSFVGPRPIPVGLTVDGILNWDQRSVVRPGLTGMAQLYCTKYTMLARKFHFDALYVKKQSLWLDIKLLVATSKMVMPLVAFVGWTAIILLATLMPISEESIPAVGAFGHIDKLAHFLLFAVMTLIAVWFGRSFLGNLGSAVGFGVIWGLLLAGGTEFAQSFLPLRNMSALDFGANMAGVGFYVLMLVFDRTETEIG